MDEGLVRIGQQLRPAALLEDLDPVRQVEVAPGEPLVEDAHDDALHPPRAGELPVDERRPREVGDQRVRQRVAAGPEPLLDVGLQLLAAQLAGQQRGGVLRRQPAQSLTQVVPQP